MNRKLLIKILELLEGTYPAFYHAGKLTGILGLSLDGEFSKIIRYLEKSEKIEVRRIGQDPSQNERERYYSNDEIEINHTGINFLNELLLIETREKLNLWIVAATIVIAVSTLANLIYLALR